MNPLASDTLKRLRRETGATLDPIDDYDRIKALVDAAEATLDAEHSPMFEALLRRSVSVGGVTLHRLSHGARCFYSREIQPEFRDDGEFCDISFCWCMAHSPNPEYLWTFMNDMKRLKKAVQKWERQIKCPTEELIQAVEDFHAVSRPQEKKQNNKTEKIEHSKKVDLSVWIQAIAKETGRSIEELVWKCPDEELVLLLTPPSQGDAESAPDPNAPNIQALKNFKDIETELRAYLEAKS